MYPALIKHESDSINFSPTQISNIFVLRSVLSLRNSMRRFIVSLLRKKKETQEGNLTNLLF